MELHLITGYKYKGRHQTITGFKKYCLLILLAATAIAAGCSKGVSPTAPATSASGHLSRYDLAAADYDVLPVTTFTASYNAAGRIVNFFEKSGQALFSFNLTYNDDRLVRSVANNLGIQAITYTANGKPLRVDYTTLTDTGKLVYSYDTSGKLTGLLDSVKKPLKLPVRFQYLYKYDQAGDNVVQVTKNELDLQGRPTLRQYSIYTFDDKANPFTAFPYLQDANNLPGELPALVNKNNVTGIHFIGTILSTSGGGSVPVLDTITVYRASRTYEYNAKGFPLKAIEKFNDVQFNYAGNRTFTYAY